MAALGSLTAPVIVGLPAQLARIVPAADRAGALATVLACGTLAALVAAPVFGALSDRTRGRLGRRRPWMLAGSAGTLAASIALTSADTVAGVAVWWMLMQGLCNATLAAADALFADVVPERQRAAASGLYGAGTFLGTLPALALTALLPGEAPAVTIAMAAAAVAVTAVCAALIRERPAPQRAPRRRLALVDPREAPGFVAVWLQRLIVQLASSLALAFTLYFVMDRMSRTEIEAAPVTSASTAVGGAALVVVSAVAGFVAGRRGDYRPFLWASMIGLAGAACLRAVTTGPLLLWVSAAIGGAALGLFVAIDIALALRTVPAARAGAYLGVLSVASALPRLAAPLLAAFLLTLGGEDPLTGGADNYVTLYLAGAVTALCGLAALPFLRGVARGPAPRTVTPG